MQVGQLQTCFSLTHSTQCHTFRLLNDVTYQLYNSNGHGKIVFSPSVVGDRNITENNRVSLEINYVIFMLLPLRH